MEHTGSDEPRGPQGRSGRARRDPGLLVLAGSLLLVCGLLFKDYLVQERFFIFADAGSDCLEQFWPLFMFFSDLARQGWTGWWSFQIGLGTNLFTIGYYLLDLFNLPFFVLPKHLIAPSLIYLACVKVLLAGLGFYAYLRTAGRRSFSACLASLFYACSGFMLLWGQHYNFATTLVYAPLLLWAFELGLKRSAWHWLPWVVAVMAPTQFYFFYMLSCYFALYVLYRSWAEGGGDPGRSLRPVLMTALGYLIGLGLSAVLLLPTLQVMTANPRVLEGAVAAPGWLQMNDARFWISLVTRLFSDTGIYYTGQTGIAFTCWLYESPTVYAGLLTLVLLPLALRQGDRRRRTATAVFLLCMLGIFAFTYATFALNGFSAYRYRWTFIFIPCALYLLALALDAWGEEGPRRGWLLASGAGVVLVYQAAVWAGQRVFTLGPDVFLRLELQVLLAVGFIGAYLLLLFLGTDRDRRRFARAGLLLVAVVELVVIHYPTVNDRRTVGPEYQRVASRYIAGLERIVTEVRNEDPGFFRWSKDFRLTWSPMDSFYLRGFHSTTGYLSLHQPAYLRFLQGLELADAEMPMHFAKLIPPERYPLLSLLGVKYFLARTPTSALPGFRPVRTYEDTEVGVFRAPGDPTVDTFRPTLFENLNALPVAFLYDRYVPEPEFLKLGPEQKDRVILAACVVDPADQELTGALGRLDPRTAHFDLATDAQARRRGSEGKWVLDRGRLRGRVDLPATRLLCLSVPFDPGWECRSRGARVPLRQVNLGLTGLLLPPGRHDLELRFVPRGMRSGGVVSLLSLLVYGALLGTAVLRPRRTREAGAHV